MSSPRYVYAIVRRDAPLPSRLGVGESAELAMVPWGRLAAVTRCIAESSPDLTMNAVLQHELVVEAVRELGPALPVRFGTVFRNARSVALALAERYEPLAADLDRLGDKAEMSLTALWAEDASPAPHPASCESGASYLRARAAELQHEETLEKRARICAQRMNEALSELAIETRVSLVPTPRVAIRTAYLIDPAKASAFRTAFDVAHRVQVEFRMLLTGPWPPYSFAAPPDTGTEGVASTSRRAASLAQFLTDAMQERRG